MWIPAIFILFAGILKQLFLPDLSLQGQIAIGISLLWIAVALNAVTLDIGMLFAFIKSRNVDIDINRPYKVPGGNAIAKALAWVCIVVLALSVALFVYTPGEGLQLPVLLGAFVMIAIGEALIRVAEKRKQRLYSAKPTRG